MGGAAWEHLEAGYAAWAAQPYRPRPLLCAWTKIGRFRHPVWLGSRRYRGILFSNGVPLSIDQLDEALLVLEGGSPANLLNWPYCEGFRLCVWQSSWETPRRC